MSSIVPADFYGRLGIGVDTGGAHKRAPRSHTFRKIFILVVLYVLHAKQAIVAVIH